WAMTYYPRLRGLDDGSRQRQWIVDEILRLDAQAVDLRASLPAAFPGSEIVQDAQESRARHQKVQEIVSATSLSSDQKLNALWPLIGPGNKLLLEQEAEKAL